MRLPWTDKVDELDAIGEGWPKPSFWGWACQGPWRGRIESLERDNELSLSEHHARLRHGGEVIPRCDDDALRLVRNDAQPARSRQNPTADSLFGFVDEAQDCANQIG